MTQVYRQQESALIMCAFVKGHLHYTVWEIGDSESHIICHTYKGQTYGRVDMRRDRSEDLPNLFKECHERIRQAFPVLLSCKARQVLGTLALAVSK